MSPRWYTSAITGLPIVTTAPRPPAAVPQGRGGRCVGPSPGFVAPLKRVAKVPVELLLPLWSAAAFSWPRGSSRKPRPSTSSRSWPRAWVSLRSTSRFRRRPPFRPAVRPGAKAPVSRRKDNNQSKSDSEGLATGFVVVRRGRRGQALRPKAQPIAGAARTLQRCRYDAPPKLSLRATPCPPPRGRRSMQCSAGRPARPESEPCTVTACPFRARQHVATPHDRPQLVEEAGIVARRIVAPSADTDCSGCYDRDSLLA
jgi:hypothetical protein